LRVYTQNTTYSLLLKQPFKDPVPGISAIPDEANARYFHVIIAGPDSSPFAGFD